MTFSGLQEQGDTYQRRHRVKSSHCSRRRGVRDVAAFERSSHLAICGAAARSGLSGHFHVYEAASTCSAVASRAGG